jgi:hypothetical protein
MIEIMSGELGTQCKLLQGYKLVLILPKYAFKLTLRMLNRSIVRGIIARAVQGQDMIFSKQVRHR